MNPTLTPDRWRRPGRRLLGAWLLGGWLSGIGPLSPGMADAAAQSQAPGSAAAVASSQPEAAAVAPAMAPAVAASAAPAAVLQGVTVLGDDPAQPAPTTSSPARSDCPAGTPGAAAAPASAPASAPAPALLPAQDTTTLLASLIGQAITTPLTQRIVDVVAEHIAKAGRFLADAYFPPALNQRVQDGRLTLVVRPARLGRITAVGQQHTRAIDIECRIHLRPNEVIDLAQLGLDLQRLNNGSSWRQTDVQPEFKPGALPGQTDIVLTTRDAEPRRVQVSIDNTGSRATGLGRLRLGFSLGHVFGQFDHALDYSYTSAENPKALQSHAFSYTLPVADDHRLALRLDHALTDVDMPASGLRATGSNSGVNLEWQYSPLPAAPGGAEQAWQAGIEIKRAGSALAFNQAPVSDRAPMVVQAYGAARTQWADSLGSNRASLRVTASPGNLGGQNSDEAFNAARPGAKAGYWRANFSADKTLVLPQQWALTMHLAGQWAGGALIASERYGLSGVGGVRGYYQDTLVADSGLVAGLELQSPQWAAPLGGDNARWQWVGFAEAGQSWNASEEHNADFNRTDTRFRLASVGLGLRYSWDKHITLRLDAGRRLNGLLGAPPLYWHGFGQVAF